MNDNLHSGEMHTRVGRLEASVEALHSEVGNLKAGQEEIKASQDRTTSALYGLSEKLGKSKEANYPFMLQIVVGCVAIMSAIGGVFIAPLRVADAYHEAQLNEIRVQVKSDHDYLIRLQEREAIRREMGK